MSIIDENSTPKLHYSKYQQTYSKYEFIIKNKKNCEEYLRYYNVSKFCLLKSIPILNKDSKFEVISVSQLPGTIHQNKPYRNLKVVYV